MLARSLKRQKALDDRQTEPMGGKAMKETMRCKNCGADFEGIQCIHCGSSDFVDVSRFYDQEVLSHYMNQRKAVEL